jgi:hypothetical protein
VVVPEVCCCAPPFSKPLCHGTVTVNFFPPLFHSSRVHTCLHCVCIISTGDLIWAMNLLMY